MKFEVAVLDSPPNNPDGLYGRKATVNLNNNSAKLGSCARNVEVAVLGSVSLMLVIVGLRGRITAKRKKKKEDNNSTVFVGRCGAGVTMAYQVQSDSRADPAAFVRTFRFSTKEQVRRSLWKKTPTSRR